MAAVGFAVGVTSLSISIFKDCLNGYEFYCRAKTLPEDYKFFFLRLQIEKQRFLALSHQIGLLELQQKVYDDLQQRKPLVIEVIRQINTLFTEAKKKHRKYIGYLPDDLVAGEGMDVGPQFLDDIGLSALIEIEKADTGVKPVRSLDWQGIRSMGRIAVGRVVDTSYFTWASKDKKYISDLVSRLAQCNADLAAELDPLKKDQQISMMDAVVRTLIALSDKVQLLLPLREALEIPCLPSPVHTTDMPLDRNDSLIARLGDQRIEIQGYLKDLFQIKQHYKESLGPDSTRNIIRNRQPLDLHDIMPSSSSDTTQRGYAIYKSDAVCIDWKNPRTIQINNEAHENRSKLLVDLISRQTTIAFRTPECLGYVERHIPMLGQIQHGIVFKIPKGHAKTTFIDLRALLKLVSKPSLSDRLNLCSTLADSIHNLHTVDWLHKGIRSRNIVFIADDPKHEVFDFCQPYLLGFELSRPDFIKELTIEPAEFRPSEDIYRHPSAYYTSDDNGSYCKSYDLYSLAIVFIEIATWQPIGEFLKISELDSYSYQTLKSVKIRTLEEHKIKLSAEVGNTFAQVVDECLRAGEIDDQDSEDEEISEMEIAKRLETLMTTKVIRPLHRLKEIV